MGRKSGNGGRCDGECSSLRAVSDGFAVGFSSITTMDVIESHIGMVIIGCCAQK